MRTWLVAMLLVSPLPALAAPKTVTVSATVAADFRTVQSAIDAISDGNRDHIGIHILPGTYKEKLKLPRSKPFVTLRGDDAKTTLLTNDWNASHVGAEGRPVGTSGSYSVQIDAADFLAENITFENTAGDTGQALALSATYDRQVYRNCRLIGWQDTLYANGGRQYYDHCFIEGRVDFIFGNATAVFDHCNIHSKNGGHVTAASTPQDHPYGYVFLDCTLTGEGAAVDLGRPWRPYASVIFARCEIGPHVKPAGWDNWRNPANEKTARYAEYKCTGPGADRSKRVPWSRELSDEEAAKLTIDNILGGPDHWDPRRVK
jgi:pectinesterase